MKRYGLSVIALVALACGACGTGTSGGPGSSTAAVAATGTGGAGGDAAACDAARVTVDTCVTNAEASCPDAVTALNTCLDVNHPDDGDGDGDSDARLPPGMDLPPNFPCKTEIDGVRTCIAGCDADMQAAHDACAGLHGGCPGMGNHPDGKGPHGGDGPHDGRGPHHR